MKREINPYKHHYRKKDLNELVLYALKQADKLIKKQFGGDGLLSVNIAIERLEGMGVKPK